MTETEKQSQPYHYVVLRKDLSGGAALAQLQHAAGESAALHVLSKVRVSGEHMSFGNQVVHVLPHGFDPLVHQLHPEMRVSVLGATKEELATLLEQLLRENVQHKAITETDGPLTGMVTAVGLFAEDKAAMQKLVPALAALKSFSLK